MSGDLGRRSVTGVLWHAATFGLSKFVIFVTTVILARLLEPADFGLLGIGLLVIGYLEIINDFGVPAAVIQRSGAIDRPSSVAFWLNIALGITLTAVGFVSAPLFASFFNEPRAGAILQALSFSFIIKSLGAIHEARLRRDLQFRGRMVPELGKGLAKGAVAVALALAGFGVWSLVWGQLAGELAAAVLYWVTFPWRPRFRFDRGVLREIAGFGSQIMLVGLFGGVLKNIDYLLIARQLGIRQLGLYTLAFRMPELLIESVVSITGDVAFSAFSRIQHDLDRLRDGLRRILELTSSLIVPVGLGLALTAAPFIELFYGERWTQAIPVAQLLALYMLLRSLSRNYGDLYKAMGRPDILNKLAVLKLAIVLPLLLFAVSRGIVAVAAAQVAAEAILIPVQVVLAAHMTSVRVKHVLRAFVPAVRAGACMTVACLALLAALQDALPVITLAATVTVGAVTYTAAMLVFDRRLATEVLSLLRLTRETALPHQL